MPPLLRRLVRVPPTTRLFSTCASRSSSALASFRVPSISNEPNHHYAKDSAQRKSLHSALSAFQSRLPLQVPLYIQGKPSSTSKKRTQFNPASHSTAVASFSLAQPADVERAIDGALKAKIAWEALPFSDRAAVFLKAADLLSTTHRHALIAATMVGQGKNAWQAEIDAAAELVDFLRFNVKYAQELYATQPQHNSRGVWNRLEYRPLDGFVYAVSPFNFTAIAGNLPCAPALLGNVVVWKPSDSAMASNWLLYQVLLEAGLPEGVIQFVPGDAREVTSKVLAHKQFAALHFTGSTAVFRELYGEIGKRTAQGLYTGYPRVVGETGGKNFHLIHASADVENAAIQTVRGAFEYQGQKCSATSRVYVPESIWPRFKERLVAETEALAMGNPTEFGNFIGPVIHEQSFSKLASVIDAARDDKSLTLLAGGTYDKSDGFYVRPTIYMSTDPKHDIMTREFFGPILGVYVYDDAAAESFRQICSIIDTTSPYSLTGSVFAKDRIAIREAEERLRHAAGNFYVNCKSTGAVVGQQPFGGGRASGTNDKAGSAGLLSRFVSVRSIKEEFCPISEVAYPSNEV